MIKFENVTKDYVLGDELIHALDDVSINISEGEYIGILGPSGSGKSTLMNIMGCLDVVSSGAYYLDGLPYRRVRAG